MKNLLLKTLLALLVIQGMILVAPSVVRAEEMTCPPPLMVGVDIKPADAVNVIKLSARGTIPVAVLSTSEFDASRFRPEMAHLNDASLPMDCNGATAVRWNGSDVNGDGLTDWVFFFRYQDLNLTSSSTAATLMAHGSYNGTTVHIMGTDAVIVK